MLQFRFTPMPLKGSPLDRVLHRLRGFPLPHNHVLIAQDLNSEVFLQVRGTALLSAQRARRALDASQPGVLGTLLRRLNWAAQPHVRLFLPEDAEAMGMEDVEDNLRSWGHGLVRREDGQKPRLRDLKRLAHQHGEDWLRRERLGPTLLPDFPARCHRPLNQEWQQRCDEAHKHITALSALPDSPWEESADFDDFGLLQAWAAITPWAGKDKHDPIRVGCQEEHQHAWNNGEYNTLFLPNHWVLKDLKAALRFQHRVVWHVASALKALDIQRVAI